MGGVLEDRNVVGAGWIPVGERALTGGGYGGRALSAYAECPDRQVVTQIRQDAAESPKPHGGIDLGPCCGVALCLWDPG